MASFSFKILQKDKNSNARVGILKTPHGDIETPNFNPVGTQATVKTLSAQDLKEIGAQIVLSNTYHLMLRPGADVIEKMGGLAKFMAWTTSSSRVPHIADAARSRLDGTRSASHSLRSLHHSKNSSDASAPAVSQNARPRGTVAIGDSSEEFSRAKASRETEALKSLPTMTDSGGFQVFSLGVAQKKTTLKDINGRSMSKFSKSVFLTPADTQFLLPSVTKTRQEKIEQKLKAAKVVEDGVWFYSHIDGSRRWFDAAVSIEMQEKMGADLIVAFDDHESPLWNYEMTKVSLDRTHRWGLASLQAHTRKDQLMYGIVHGGAFEQLRKESAEFVNKHFEAISIGGSYTSKDVLYTTLDWCVPYFDEGKPRHLLGIGEVQDLFEGISRGMDLFDCVAPTRRGRHGTFYVSPQNGGKKENNFVMQITNAKFTLDTDPIDPGCHCYTCQHFTRSYIRHLFMADELLAQRLGSYHNVYFIVNLVKRIREAIKEGSFAHLKQEWLR